MTEEQGDDNVKHSKVIFDMFETYFYKYIEAHKLKPKDALNIMHMVNSGFSAHVLLTLFKKTTKKEVYYEFIKDIHDSTIEDIDRVKLAWGLTDND